MGKESITLTDSTIITQAEAVFCNPGDDWASRRYHDWIYLGKTDGRYKCRSCGRTMQKQHIRELTNE